MNSNNKKTDVNVNSDIDHLFPVTPNGITPTLESLKRIIQNDLDYIIEKNVLIFIATDGQPTNGESNDLEVAKNKLEKYISYLLKQYPNLYITFMACNSDESLLETMDKWGQKFNNVGVINQFGVEYKEMMDSHNNMIDWTFTIGDFILKAMLVSLDPDIKKIFNDKVENDYCKCILL